jgi:microcystin-dependent protein
MPNLTVSNVIDTFLDANDLAAAQAALSIDDFLPLAGGIMDDNATIGFDNSSAIREAGAQGLEIECSVGYRWQWVAGRMILRQVNSGQIQRVLGIDGVTPGSSDDSSNGFIVGTRWETQNGTIYECTDSTNGAAVWAAASSGWPWVTGDRRTGYWTDPGVGWVLANGGTIGNANSSADRANADTEALFELIYNIWLNVAPGSFPMSGEVFGDSRLLTSSGQAVPAYATAAEAWAANYRLVLPAEGTRTAVMWKYGVGLAGVPAVIGAQGGSETHTLTEAELPVVAGHTHTQSAHDHNVTLYNNSSHETGVILPFDGPSGVGTAGDSGSGGDEDTGSSGGFGSGTAHNNVQPFICINVAIKL